MNVPVIFNRRLGRNEINQLLDLIECTRDSATIDRIQASKFFQLDDAIAFLSSIEDEAIGGTIVYRDRTRLGMVLAAIAIKDEYRDLGLYTVIKSSLPFFKSVAIRDVDVIISENSKDDNLGFPFSFCLPSWTRVVLERIGFIEEQKLFKCTLKLARESLSKSGDISWDTKVNLEGAKSLIWDEGKISGLTNSLTWMSLDFGAHSKTLHTLTDENSTKLVFCEYNYAGIAIVSLLATREKFYANNMAVRILSSAIRETKATDIRFPLIGKGQLELLEAIADKIGGSLKKESITLMRRRF